MRDEIAGGRGRLRASHADREQVIGTLKSAFVQGRLDKDELDARLGQAFTARTYAELAAVAADIPAGPIPQPARPPENRVVKSGLTVIGVATSLAVGLWAVALFSASATVFAMAFTATIAYAGVLILAGSVMLDSRQQNRSVRQLTSS